jgi:hypothetical protein
MRNFAELVKKHGFGMVLSALTIDGYRRTYRNDKNAEQAKEIRE